MKKSSGHAPLHEICMQFGVDDVYDLSQLHLRHDQNHIKKNSFDPTSKRLVNNRIKDALLDLPLDSLSSEEREVAQGILWLWHHHVATIYVWRKKNLTKARESCKTALTYLYPGHPNKITPMLCFLLNGQIKKARTWATKQVGEVERPYADHLLEEYEKGVFTDKVKGK